MIVEQYTAHVWTVSQILRKAHSDDKGVMCAVMNGSNEEYSYQAFPFVEGASLLADLIKAHGPAHPGIALKYLAEICKSLSLLHRRQIVHGDLKPSNILINHQDCRAYLIDLGMAAFVNNQRDLILVGTPRYLAPDIIQGSSYDRRTFRDEPLIDPKGETPATKIEFARGRKVGSYVDIYSLGIIMLELTTAAPTPPELVSASVLLSRLKSENPQIGSCEARWVDELSRLIVSMLLVEPDSDWDALEDIFSKSLDLSNHILSEASDRLKSFSKLAGSLDVQAMSAPAKGEGTQAYALSVGAGAVTWAVLTLNSVSEDLVGRTVILVREQGKLQAISHDEDQLQEKINHVFENALSRSRSRGRLAWR